MRLALACGALSVAFGVIYLFAAGAPPHYLLSNVGALALGVSVAAVARISGMWKRLGTAAGVTTIAIGLLLAAIACFGTPVAGASRWIVLAGLPLQPSLILLPAAMVAFAAHRDVFSLVGLAIAGVALGMQPDRAMSGTLVSGLGALWIVRRRESGVALAIVAAMAGFVIACIRPDVVPPAAHVEQVVQSSFAVHPLVGLVIVAGLVTMLVPAAVHAGLSLDGHDPSHVRPDGFLIFGATWLAIIASSMIGNYPTPLVGYGSSAILGYCLSASALLADSSKS